MQIMDNALEIILITSIIVWILVKYRDRGSTSTLGESDLKELIEKLPVLEESSKRMQEMQQAVESGSKSVQGLALLFKGSATRGAWGELSLRNAVEHAGMTKHVDFNEQKGVTNMSGQVRRMDIVIHYPDGTEIVLDAKQPMEAYFKSLETDDHEVREKELDNHVKQVKVAVDKLSGQKYPSLLNKSPDFTIMYMGNEAAYLAAMERDPKLAEYALRKKIVLTGPLGFVTYLNLIHLAWEQAALRENAREIGIVAKELTRRFETLLEHLQGVYKGLNQAGNNWNKFVSSYERRFLTQAKKLSDLDVWENVPELDRLDVDTRELAPAEVEQAISSNGHRG